MAADSYRLDVLKKLTSHLRGITKANGYNHDLDASVFRGRTIFGENDPIPMLSILEAPRSDPGSFAAENGYERKEDWSLLIQGWARDDVDNPTDPAYELMDDVEKHLSRLIAVSTVTGMPVYPEEYMLNRSVAGIAVLPGVVRPPMEQVSSRAFFYLPLRLTLVKNNG